MRSSWKLIFDEGVEKQLRKLDPENYKRVSRKLREMTIDPTPPGAKRLQGQKSFGWRVRVGKLRILYRFVAESRELQVYSISARDEAYS